MSNEEQKVIEALREYFGVANKDAFSSYKVLRIDSGGYYWLTSFFDERKSTTKVAIINSNFQVTQYGNVGQRLTLEKPEAVTLAESSGAIIELVWRPCKISYSPFYPFWRVGLSDQTYYVDFRDKIYNATDLDQERSRPG